MSVLDVILLVVVGVFMIRGLLRGVVREAIGLVALVAAGFMATTYAGTVGQDLVARDWVRPEIASAVAGGGVFLATYVAANLIGLFLDRLARALLLGPLLRLAGMAFAMLKASVLLGLALVAGQRLAPSLLTPADLGASRLARPMMALAAVVLDFGGEWIGDMAEAVDGVTT